jgi:hypothetical protein
LVDEIKELHGEYKAFEQIAHHVVEAVDVVVARFRDKVDASLLVASGFGVVDLRRPLLFVLMVYTGDGEIPSCDRLVLSLVELTICFLHHVENCFESVEVHGACGWVAPVIVDVPLGARRL